MAEGQQPLYYNSGGNGVDFSFALPGKRYLRVGSYVNDPFAIQRVGVMLAVTKQNGDTVRYVQVRVHPPGQGEAFSLGAVAEPDHSVTVFAGYYPTPRVPGGDSLLLLRIDTLGIVRWRHGYRLANCLPSTSLGNLFRTGDGYLLCTNRNAFPGVAGPSYYTPNVTKIDFQGNVVWERSMGTRGYGRVGSVYDLVACPDGSYLAFGNTDDGTPYVPGTSSRGRLDYFVSKFTSAGDTLRTYRFGDPGEDEQGERIRLTPDGGSAITGTRARYSAFPPPMYDGQVYKLDSLFRPQWHVTQSGPTPASPPNAPASSAPFKLFQPLASGHVLCGGDYTGHAFGATGDGILTSYTPAGAVQWDYRRRYLGRESTGFNTMVNHPDGSAYLTGYVGVATGPGTYQAYAYSAYLANVGVPYVPDLCARPPVAGFAAAAGPATVQVLDTSRAGPRYGVLVAWAWDWGDGRRSTGRAPGPHAYATPPPAGTAVTLTVTNNLGCTATYTAYPFGPLSATQQARALAARLVLYPNPTSGAVAVELGGLAPQGPAALALLGPLGQVLRRSSAPVQAGQVATTLDLGGLPAGLYLLRVTTQEGTATKRLVKE